MNKRRLARFAIVGAVGFAVDSGTLYAALHWGLGSFSGRIASFTCAVVVTWALNRRFTFTPHRQNLASTFAEFFRYFASMLGGGSVNLAVYALLMPFISAYIWGPGIAVAFGALAGMLVNFAAASKWAFRIQNASTEQSTQTTPIEKQSSSHHD